MPGPPAPDDLVERKFTAQRPNQLWLTDITEHWTDQGKLYLCAIKDVWPNRIVGYSISDRMKSRIAVDALNMAVSRRGDVAGCICSFRQGVAISVMEVPGRASAPPSGRIDGPGRLRR